VETIPLAGELARMAGHHTRRDFIGFPARRLAVAVMTNISFADTRSVAVKIAEVFASGPR
jgi:hypothetical protein